MDSFEDVKPYAVLPSRHHKYTMRTLFEQYSDAGGVCWVDADPPEYSVTSSTGELTCMVRTRCPVGLPHGGLYVGPRPALHSSLEGALDAVLCWIGGAIDSGHLWCPPGSVRAECTAPGVWILDKLRLGASVCTEMDRVQACGFVPLSVSTVHAALESERIQYEAVFRGLYPYPRTTVPSTSLFGTSHNNSFVDMSPFEKEKEPDMKSREFLDEHVGFVCASHTSHSYEAGKSRRVTTDVLVRLLDYKAYSSIERLKSREVRSSSESKSWTFYCAGQICWVTESTVDQFCILHRLLSMSSDPGFGLYIKVDGKVCVASVSSGILTKLCTNGVWSDNMNAHSSDRMKFSLCPRIATSGPDFHRSCLSSHYSYVPFIEHNAAVRTSISSAQITQAVCLPFCPATAAVSPCNVFKPIVTTRTYARIMIEQEDSFDMASYLPGENVCILYHNLELNYEDAVIVSRRYVENGGFSTVSTCRYLLPASDYVPSVGKMLCSKLCKWWKSKCQVHCKHTMQYIENCSVTSPFGPPTGVVVSRRVLKTGEQSVKIRSYETFQPGNKVSTAHGQKGVAADVVNYEDMPICYTRSRQQIVPDVVMAVGSIVSRQTAGQIYESGASIERLKDPSISHVVEPDSVAKLGEEVMVMDPTTGRFFTTVATSSEHSSSDPFLKGTKATLGFVRMFNQSQMTRERHFTSHRTMHPTTLRTPTKRSRGGALREGEMEIQATVAAGLSNCAEELRRRGDEVVVLVCMRCQRLRLLHSCTMETEFAEVTLPYDMVVLDCVNKITYNCVFKYTLEPDV